MPIGHWALRETPKAVRHLRISIFLVLLLGACSKEQQTLPDELQLSDPAYEISVSHAFGPGGINHAFKVYDLEADVGRKINQSGLGFLSKMESAVNYPDEKNEARKEGGYFGPYWTSYTDWKPLPIPKDDNWIRRARVVAVSDQPIVEEFFGDNDSQGFTSTIDRSEIDKFLEVIRGKEGYYSYGGYREMNLLVVSPHHAKAYYLFRD
ncbi:hypothetical protein EUU23_00410 [Sphingorhabdus sp. IMCC26285]|uniref:Uncharacterized protein n=1 Tax=Sphingorhabdus profundilacus TaxID=2509718 RepID=A0A6I4LVB8_9SPHN|nr:hypothetical protein [Sphingorhabdus profundilacus]MVZ96163.1 hypothetical protein [Sphingorhabdus profundilacus]